MYVLEIRLTVAIAIRAIRRGITNLSITSFICTLICVGLTFLWHLAITVPEHESDRSIRTSQSQTDQTVWNSI